jgi:hypothetical protein
MSWHEHHTKSEHLASEAEAAFRAMQHSQAKELYRQAAEAEAAALAEIDMDKKRTVSITVVSSISLYYKSGDLTKVRELAQ